MAPRGRAKPPESQEVKLWIAPCGPKKVLGFRLPCRRGLQQDFKVERVGTIPREASGGDLQKDFKV